MNYKLFLQILLILAIISTVCICTTKPKMHKTLMVYNSDFIVKPESVVDVEVTNIPVVEKVSTTPEVNVQSVDLQAEVKNFDVDFQTTSVKQPAIQNKVVKTVSQTKVLNEGKKIVNQNVVAKSIPVQTKTTKVVSNPVSKTNQTPQIDLQKIIENNKKIQNAKNETDDTLIKQIQQPVKKVETQTLPAVKPQTKDPVLSIREEEIAWNIWHSNLQNQIMKDVHIPLNIPNGTIFRFSFDVDKFGKITNVQTWSDNNKYTPHAIQYIAPVIRSYQGRSILNFPKGSNRVSKKFVGAWKMSNVTKYSSPQDYNDVERIIK